jgi:hypothetical protein
MVEVPEPLQLGLRHPQTGDLEILGAYLLERIGDARVS